jgi:CHAP domain
MTEDTFPVPAVTKHVEGSVGRLLEIAKSQIGYIEGPKDNETKYGKWSGANFQPWCGSYVNWCADQAGVKIPRTVYTPAGAEAFKKKNQWFDAQVADPEPGDIAYFNFPGVTGICHVGIVAVDNEDGTVWCYEGNTTGDGKKGSQRNGGEAAKKLRAYKKNKAGVMVSIVGFGRPKFKGSAKTASNSSVPAGTVCPTCGK